MLGGFMKYGGGWEHMSGWGPFGAGFGGGLVLGPLFLGLLLWTLYWKYRALWHAAKNDEKWWFIALLVINTLGILEIIYLYFLSKNSLKKSKHDENNVPMVPQK